MIHLIRPRYWLRFALAHRAVRHYPLYDVPHKQDERTLDEGRIQENFSYFMRERLNRLAFFRSWLRTSFHIDADLDGGGLRKVSRWVDDYGGALVGAQADDLTVYACYQPRWEDSCAGYNVMMDIGIFLGEYLITKRPGLYWEIYRGDEDEPASFRAAEYLKPDLGGTPRRWRIFPLRKGYGVIANSRELALIQSNYAHASPDALVTIAKSALYMTRVLADPDTVVVGDSSNEPL
jgi:hypothetical protein